MLNVGVMCCGSAMGSRFIVEECFKWAHQRKVFGKALIEQPVIRAKFANMVSTFFIKSLTRSNSLRFYDLIFF